MRYFDFPKHRGYSDGSTLKNLGRLDRLLLLISTRLSRLPGRVCSSFPSEEGITISDLKIP